MRRDPGSATKVAVSLTKASWRRKISVVLAALLSPIPALADNRTAQTDLRDCIAQAQDAAAVMACEVTQQAVLKARIERWSAGIRNRLDTRQRQVFEHNAKAWQAFVESEISMLDLTLDLRDDGLSAKLRPGAVTRLYEDRERQLREHLHNLSYARGG